MQIKREIRILKHLRHPNVVDLKQVMASKTKIYMVMELVAGGELFDKVVGDGPMPVSGSVVRAAYLTGRCCSCTPAWPGVSLAGGSE